MNHVLRVEADRVLLRRCERLELAVALLRLLVQVRTEERDHARDLACQYEALLAREGQGLAALRASRTSEEAPGSGFVSGEAAQVLGGGR